MLPDPIFHWFLGLFLVSLGVFVVIPAIFSYWRLAHNGQARAAHMRMEDAPAILIALLLINLFCYFLGSEGSHPIPHDILRLLLAALDIPFLLFLLDTLIVFLVTKRQTTEVISDVPKETSTSSAEA